MSESSWNPRKWVLRTVGEWGPLFLYYNSHDSSLYADTKWTWDFVEGLQEGLGFIAVTTGVKHEPVTQRRTADQRYPTHLFGPVSCPGVVLILGDINYYVNLSIKIVWINPFNEFKRTNLCNHKHIIPILIPGKSSPLGGLCQSALGVSYQSWVPTYPTPTVRQHSYKIIFRI